VSSKENAPAHLDRTIPFVDAILRIVEGEAAHAQAVALLEDAEARHGLHIVYSPKDALLGGPYLPIDDDDDRPSLSEVLHHVSEWPLFQQRYVLVSEEIEQAALQTSLFPFPSDTGVILQGMEFSDEHFIVFSSGLLVSWTQRAWGQVMAEWANSVGWAPRYDKRGDRYSWNYVDFYGGSGLLDGYMAWAQTVQDVIHDTWARQLAKSRDTP